MTGIKWKYENISPALPMMKTMQNLNEGQRNELRFPVAGNNSNMKGKFALFIYVNNNSNSIKKNEVFDLW